MFDDAVEIGISTLGDTLEERYGFTCARIRAMTTIAAVDAEEARVVDLITRGATLADDLRDRLIDKVTTRCAEARGNLKPLQIPESSRERRARRAVVLAPLPA